MVVSAAFRLSWTPLLSGVFVFYLPIVWIGYDPVWVFGMASAGLTYQFFVHTELVKRIGWLEWVLNTPSAHRVHHASNPQYIDKNFGGVLMIWDHLFGTYQAERPVIKIRYGLATRGRRRAGSALGYRAERRFRRARAGKSFVMGVGPDRAELRRQWRQPPRSALWIVRPVPARSAARPTMTLAIGPM